MADDGARRLLKLKKELGPVTFVGLNTSSLVDVHRTLGRLVQTQVLKTLVSKLGTLSGEELGDQIRLSRQVGDTIREKASSSAIDRRIRDALGRYLVSLAAWQDGVQVDRFVHDQLRGRKVDGQPIAGQDLALLLQNDSSQCQTGIYREGSGAAILWHTEEDTAKLGERFDKLRVLSFAAGNGQARMSTFIYPDLLPGPAFGWRSDGFFQAVDALYVRSGPENGSMLANIAVWMTLQLGHEIEAAEIVQAIGPYVDGYALFTARVTGKQVRATRIEFVGSELAETPLDDQEGSFLFQVNVCSDKNGPLAQKYEDISVDDRRPFEERIVYTERMMQAIQASGDPESYLFRLLCSRVGGDFAYANDVVKSYLLVKLAPEEMSLLVGGGPAFESDQPALLTYVLA